MAGRMAVEFLDPLGRGGKPSNSPVVFAVKLSSSVVAICLSSVRQKRNRRQGEESAEEGVADVRCTDVERGIVGCRLRGPPSMLATRRFFMAIVAGGGCAVWGLHH